MIQNLSWQIDLLEERMEDIKPLATFQKEQEEIEKRDNYWKKHAVHWMKRFYAMRNNIEYILREQPEYRRLDEINEVVKLEKLFDEDNYGGVCEISEK
jgi:dynactin complex subunit